MLSRYEKIAKIKQGHASSIAVVLELIPSDMGVLFLQQQAKLQFGQTVLKQWHMRVAKMKGAAFWRHGSQYEPTYLKK